MPYNNNIKKVLVIGSGPIVIGQAAEFDYAGTQSCLALKEEGIEVVLLNSNPATIMTDEQIADRIYIEPITVETVEEIIKIEKPDGLIGTLGGQTGLNITVQLYEKNIFEKYNVTLLGTSVDSIQKGEDREKFRKLMIQINEPIPESMIVRSVDEGIKFVEKIGFPIIIRPAYTLGGAGGGFANSFDELIPVLQKGLSLSPINQVLVETSIKGWKEIEYEVVRDANDTCIIVCNMENFDPVGVHTGDSIVVAPSQTLSDVQYQILRNASLKVIRALGVIGGCNIQFALDPKSNQYYIIEVNPRVSRSSALASKATGYPIARIATKCAIGYHLDEIINPVTGTTFASFEPALDYIVVKLPRFPFDKFPEANRKLGTQMKATGETMAIDRTFEGALNKALRSIEYKVDGLSHPYVEQCTDEQLKHHINEPTDLRLFAIAKALRKGISMNELYESTKIDYWFLNKMKGMIHFENIIKQYTIDNIPIEQLEKAKKMNMSDKYISSLLKCKEQQIRQKRKEHNLTPSYKLVDTCAGEFEAQTPYYYSTWNGMNEVDVTNKKKALIIGSGPIRIGQGIEFDYCCVHAILALKKQGYETIVVNNNPETVSTDYSVADKLYFEPITFEDVLHIVEKEKPDGVFIQFGGQTAINLAEELVYAGVKVFGTSIEAIDLLEDRQQFYQLLNKLNIPHIQGEIAYNNEMVKKIANQLSYPVIIRPSYVIGGQSMSILYKEEELESYLSSLTYTDERIWPLVVDQYLPGLECELDCISDGNDVFIPGIFEHIEKAGVHSGDSISVYPPKTLTTKEKQLLHYYTRKICKEAGIVGVANIQFVIHQQQIYCLEVNPRASRTVPILSKITGIPIIDIGISVQLGKSLEQTGIASEAAFTSIKAPVFSFRKLQDVDPILGPEMKSTGEVLGLGNTYETALCKAMNVNETDRDDSLSLFCSINDREKETFIQFIKKINCKIYATEGTARSLIENGVMAVSIEKEKQKVSEIFDKEKFDGAIILPTKGRDKEKFGSYIRELALKYEIPLFTSLDTFESVLTIKKSKEIKVKSLNDYKYSFVNK
ncbi:carbamoyl-phosphate synthase (glutamine-hydrolyzing) large subunit [Heyndrickxia sporothermodurans]|uniref:carbamoyl-phosphate synthase (glutamine-hydrolyzing) large subunit n=1 Tax=Heyndrickxia sporothermodurans TaxID=46224 RepID=UPI002DB76939|nr:carbamoyl-phosphate synthase (glutamine-hydrolyzing) large subunit [Heyndrickxia sporothermodurans]MEB6548324.1 carbamoyl-phosphate synthase (glutamine-hydrolyzing) large subunit [Heyndrickxia sporothermodurans]